jgi:type IV pilus assembly protein PilA
MKNQKGFSLVELLVVVIIIAIVAAIAIPNLLASRRAANEASAISSLRTIHSAQATYQATTGGNVDYAAALTDLSGSNLIDTALASGTKSGYAFTNTTASGIYCAEAHPVTAGTTGDRFFSVSEAGVIFSQTSVAGCAAGVLTPGTSAAPIQ